MRRVNSDARIIQELSHALLRMRVRPYYLHQMDVAEGSSTCGRPSRKGVEILEQLRGHTTGPRRPAPRGGPPGRRRQGELQPEYVVERRGHETVFRNFVEASRTCIRSGDRLQLPIRLLWVSTGADLAPSSSAHRGGPAGSVDTPPGTGQRRPERTSSEARMRPVLPPPRRRLRAHARRDRSHRHGRRPERARSSSAARGSSSGPDSEDGPFQPLDRTRSASGTWVTRWRSKARG